MWPSDEYIICKYCRRWKRRIRRHQPQAASDHHIQVGLLMLFFEARESGAAWAGWPPPYTSVGYVDWLLVGFEVCQLISTHNCAERLWPWRLATQQTNGRESIECAQAFSHRPSLRQLSCDHQRWRAVRLASGPTAHEYVSAEWQWCTNDDVLSNLPRSTLNFL
jgi:hypothetical protein